MGSYIPLPQQPSYLLINSGHHRKAACFESLVPRPLLSCTSFKFVFFIVPYSPIGTGLRALIESQRAHTSITGPLQLPLQSIPTSANQRPNHYEIKGIGECSPTTIRFFSIFSMEFFRALVLVEFTNEKPRARSGSIDCSRFVAVVFSSTCIGNSARVLRWFTRNTSHHYHHSSSFVSYILTLLSIILVDIFLIFISKCVKLIEKQIFYYIRNCKSNGFGFTSFACGGLV